MRKKGWLPYILQIPSLWAKEQELESWYHAHQRLLEDLSTQQFLVVIDKTIAVDGETEVEEIPNGAVYVDGYVSRGTGSGTITIGDANDNNGLLETDGTGLVRFDGAYLTTKYESPKGETVSVYPAGFSGTVRVVVQYYIPGA